MEKDRLEQGAFETFASLYNANAARGHLEFVSHRMPPYPDLECTLDGRPLFVEVAHVFGTAIDARAVVRHGTRSEPSAFEKNADVVVANMEERIITPLNSTIAEHCIKDYMGSPLWLLVRIGNPLYDLSEFNMYKHRLLAPAQHPFDEIWLMCGPFRESGAVQLWPTV